MPRKKAVTTASATEAVEMKASEPKTEEIKTEEKAAEVKKAPAKKATDKAAAAKTTAAKKEPAKKAEMKSSLHLQYAGRSYAQEDLIKIAKDVWKYDLKRKVGELKSVDLYVKPEENKVYYVMNEEFTGSFDI